MLPQAVHPFPQGITPLNLPSIRLNPPPAIIRSQRGEKAGSPLGGEGARIDKIHGEDLNVQPAGAIRI